MDFKEILHFKLFNIGNTTVEVSSLIFLALFVTGLYLLLAFAKKLIYRSAKLDDSKKFTFFALLRYFVYVIGFVLALDILGFNPSVLMAGSAALLVGIGLGLQNLFSDFVSGIILLVDSSIRVGDVIQVDDLVCEVKDIRLRTTSVLTRDDKYIILPNTMLTKNQLINWTHNKKLSRFDVTVGVAYHSDVNAVRQVLLEAAKENPQVANHPAPFTRLKDYDSSAVIFSLYFWTENVFRAENIKSDLRLAIFELLRQRNIEIPFPQQVIHLSKEGLTALKEMKNK